MLALRTASDVVKNPGNMLHTHREEIFSTIKGGDRMKNYSIYGVKLVIMCVVAIGSVPVRGQPIREYPRRFQVEDYLREPAAMGKDYVLPATVPSIRQGEEEREEPYKMAPPTELKVGEIFQDRVLDPKSYKLVPGDQITIYLWGELDKPYILHVTPEGVLIIPTVGPLEVADLTLDEAKKKIKEIVGQKYEDIRITVQLTAFRQFKVHISGAVRYPGMYPAFGMDRVSDIIDMAGGMILEQFRGYEGEITPERQRGEELAVTTGVLLSSASSQRNIQILRKGGVVYADLIKYKKLGDLESNPYVNIGDVINVPSKKANIWVSGEVYVPGFYEYKPGDTIVDLISFADGLRPRARTDQAELVRYDPDGHTTQEIAISLDDAFEGHNNNPKYLLKPFDRLYIRRKPEWMLNRSVQITGMVEYPGWYSIEKDATKLTDVIKMAGGFREEAHFEEASVIRREIAVEADPEFERLSRMYVADMSDEEYEYFKSRNREQKGRIAVDFVRLFRDNDLSEDIIMETYDLINVPQRREMVNVLGQVEFPGLMRFTPGKTWLNYLDDAGGVTWNADRRKIQIIKGATGQRFRPGKVQVIEAGDVIWVPEKKPVDRWEWFQDFSLVLANVATVVIVSRSFTR